MRFPKILKPARNIVHADSLAFEMREEIFDIEGKKIFDSEFYEESHVCKIQMYCKVFNAWT